MAEEIDDLFSLSLPVTINHVPKDILPELKNLLIQLPQSQVCPCPASLVSADLLPMFLISHCQPVQKTIAPQWHCQETCDGFWRMAVEAGGAEHNFVFQMPPWLGDTANHCMTHNAPQMEWKNSPACFCTATNLTRKLIAPMLGLTVNEPRDR